MPVFEYKALNRKGKRISGLITAEGPSAARLKISQDSLYPTEIREVKEKERGVSSDKGMTRVSLLRGINPVEISTALRQLATLVSSGLPLLECLNGLIEQTEQPRLKKVFTQIREKVVEGNSLSTAMAAHPGIFSSIHVNMVRAGETGGALGAILKRLADFSERRMKLKKKLEAALAYPLFLLMISTIILIFLMSFVMPKVISVFQGMDLSLPWTTRTLISITGFMRQFWWLVILAIGAFVVLVSLWTKTDKGTYVKDNLRLKLPLFGRLQHRAVVARFARTLSILLKSGITLVDALEIAGLSMGNRIMEDAVRETARSVGEGSDFSSPLKKTGRFPPLVIQLVRAGEQSGELEEMLAKAAEVYEDETEASIAALTAVIEPVVILAMGIIVAFIVLAILLPILDMTTGIK